MPILRHGFGLLRAATAMVASALLVAGLAGCRGVLGIDPLPPEIDAGADTSVVHDASAEAKDSHALDEATARDSGPTFCSTIHPAPSLCADFDESDFKKGWDNDHRELCPGTSGGGTIAADSKHSFSHPRSFLAATPDVVTAGASPTALLVKVLPLTPALALNLEVFVDELYIPEGSEGATTLVWLNYGDTVGYVTLVLDSAGLELAVLYPEGDHGVVLPILNPFPTGQWVGLELLVENSASDGGPDGWVYADSSGKSQSAVLPASFQVSTGSEIYPALEIGAAVQGPIGAFSVNIDNVVLDLYASPQ